MKALIVIAGCIALAFVFRVVEYFTGSRIRSVGAKSNSMSARMAKVDITNPEELKKSLDAYRNLTD